MSKEKKSGQPVDSNLIESQARKINFLKRMERENSTNTLFSPSYLSDFIDHNCFDVYTKFSKETTAIVSQALKAQIAAEEEILKNLTN